MATSDIAEDLLSASSACFRASVTGQLASLGLKLMKAHDRAVAQLTTAVQQARRTESLYQEELMRLHRELAAFEPAPPPAPEAAADRPAAPKLGQEATAGDARERGDTLPERRWLQVSRRRPCEPRDPVTCESPDAHVQDAPSSPCVSKKPASPKRPPAAEAGTLADRVLRRSPGGATVAASHPPPEKRLLVNDPAWQPTAQKPEAEPSGCQAPGACPQAATPPVALAPPGPAEPQAVAAAPGTPRPGLTPPQLWRSSPPPLRAGRTTPPSTVVLVCGVGDSGADGLLHLLALHSEIRKTARLESLTDVLCARAEEGGGEDGMTALIRRVFHHLEHARRPQSEGDVFALDSLRRLERRVTRGLAQGQPPAQAAATLFDGLLGVNTGGGRQAITVCSTVLRGEVLGVMEELYPEVKMISCVRDGRDVACSLLQDPSGPRSITEAGRLWAEGLRCSAEWAESRPRSRHLEVRYEDLARDLEGELARVLDFLGVPDQSANMVRQRARAPGPAFTCGNIGLWKQLDPLSLASLLETVGCWFGRAGYGVKAADEAEVEDAAADAAAADVADAADTAGVATENEAGVAEVVDVACKENAGRGPSQEEVLYEDDAGKDASRQEVLHEEAVS